MERTNYASRPHQEALGCPSDWISEALPRCSGQRTFKAWPILTEFTKCVNNKGSFVFQTRACTVSTHLFACRSGYFWLEAQEFNYVIAQQTFPERLQKTDHLLPLQIGSSVGWHVSFSSSGPQQPRTPALATHKGFLWAMCASWFQKLLSPPPLTFS